LIEIITVTTFFLDLSWKIREKIICRNRGGWRSEMIAYPAGFEITGTETFSAASRKAPCTHRGMRRYSGFDFGLRASLRRRTDTGIK
jgi:hypothetical protein